MFTTENTAGYSDSELDDLNSEWAKIVDANGLETDTDEYYQREKQFANEVSRR